MKTLLSILALGTSISTIVWADTEFPKPETQTMDRDVRVTDEQLLQGKTEPQFSIVVMNEANKEKYYAVDYSTLVRVDLTTIKNAIADYDNYPCYMPRVANANVIAPEQAGSLTDPEAYKAYKENPTVPVIPAPGKGHTAYFEAKLLLSFRYFLDLMITLNSDDRFGAVWTQNDALQDSLPSNQNYFKKHLGSWYVEKFQSEPNVYYVRYRDVLQLSTRVIESAYEYMVKENTKKVVAALPHRCRK